MNLDAVRALSLRVSTDALGVPITVNRPAPDDEPIVTAGIWLALPPEEPRPYGTDFQRTAPRKILAIPRSILLPTLPRGSFVTAAEEIGGTVKTWRVDGVERPAEVDEWRVRLVETVDP